MSPIRLGPGAAVVLLGPVASGLLAACGGGDPGYLVEDSSGVPVVESYRPAWGERSAWTVAPEPSLTIPQWSRPDPRPVPRDSFHLSDAKRLPDGTLLVANNYTGELAFFTRRGEPIRRVGGEGLEPGRFRSLRAVHVMDDGLWAFDQMGRWNVFDFEGELTATLYFEPHGGGWSHVEPYGQETAVLAFGGCCYPPPTKSGFTRPMTAILRYERTGAWLDTLTIVPGAEHYVQVSEDAASTFLTTLGARPVILGGRRLLYWGSGERMEIEVFGEDRRRVRVIRIPDFDLSVSDQEWDEELGRIRDIQRRFDERATRSSRPSRGETSWENTDELPRRAVSQFSQVLESVRLTPARGAGTTTL